MAEIHDILSKYWGYSAFRPLQEDIILSTIAGRDTLALLPTGGGKSICFQVPAMAMDGTCLVISPLIALMKDQVENLQQRGIPAIALHSGMSKSEMRFSLDKMSNSEFKFVYLSPERLKTSNLRERIVNMQIGLLAIDEAHCISQWGYDFRPEYLQIAEIRPLLNCPVLALTASAPEKVVADIQYRLDFKQPNVFRKSFERKNLQYFVLHEENKLNRIAELSKKLKGSGIIYARNRKLCKEIAEYLFQQGERIDFYHAGLDHQTRNKKQEAWIKGHIRIMVATNAFGMGIDKPDVRFVLHYELPDSLEAYYQEAGRAGRDEAKAWCIALHQALDEENARQRLQESYPPYEVVKRVYESLCNYLRVPVGNGQGISYPFDVNDFVKKAPVAPHLAFHALKILEQQEILQMSEAVFAPSKLHIVVDNTFLYDFELRNPGIVPLIKMILRTYGGVFDHFISIDENLLAKKLKVTKEDIIAVLSRLKEAGIIEYEKPSDSPHLTFYRSRENILHYNLTKVEERKKAHLERLDAVYDYGTQNKCRSRMILEYFDELTAEDCGQCDVCRKKNKEQSLDERIKKQLIEKVQQGIVEPTLLRQSFPTMMQEEVGHVLRYLLDNDLLTWDENKLLKPGHALDRNGN